MEGLGDRIRYTCVLRLSLRGVGASVAWRRLSLLTPSPPSCFMARKSTKMSRMRNIEPSPLTLTYALSGPCTLPTSPLVDRYFIDLSQSNSLTSRRFYRQGLNWGIAGMKFLTTSPGSLTISKLPNTWVMANAWMKAFSVWQRMNNEALAESESIRPRFLDFKIYANKAHHECGFAANQVPVSSAGTSTLGEWEPSKVVVPFGPASPGNVAEFEFVATGGNYPGVSAVTGFNAVSLIEGYAASRLLPNVLDPNTPGDADDTDGSTPENWMSATFNDGTDQTSEVLEDMILENNIAPYPFENDGVNIDTMYPGGANQLAGLEIHSLDFVTTSTIGGTTRIKGGNFPCGLIQVSWQADVPGGSPPVLQIDLIPGSHRGYLAEPMQEM